METNEAAGRPDPELARAIALASLDVEIATEQVRQAVERLARAAAALGELERRTRLGVPIRGANPDPRAVFVPDTPRFVRSLSAEGERTETIEDPGVTLRDLERAFQQPDA